MKNLFTLNHSIAIIGPKRVGKNYFSIRLAKLLVEHGIENLKEISIGDYLKMNSYTPQGFENDTFDYNYLMDDFHTFVEYLDERGLGFENYFNDKKLLGKIKLYLSDSSINFFSHFNKEEKRQFIELFKTLDGFKTRLRLQQFGDYLKNAYNNPFIFSSNLLDDIYKNSHDTKYAFSGYINTDTRFFTELIDFMLAGFYIISLYNTDLVIPKLWKEHTSELELGLADKKVGYALNLAYSGKGEFIDGLNRMPSEVFNDTVDEVIPHLLSFQGYRKEDLEALTNLKEDMLSGKIDFFNYQAKFTEAFNGFYNKTVSEDELKGVYLEYIDARDSLLNDIISITKKYYVYE